MQSSLGRARRLCARKLDEDSLAVVQWPHANAQFAPFSGSRALCPSGAVRHGLRDNGAISRDVALAILASAPRCVRALELHYDDFPASATGEWVTFDRASFEAAIARADTDVAAFAALAERWLAKRCAPEDRAYRRVGAQGRRARAAVARDERTRSLRRGTHQTATPSSAIERDARLRLLLLRAPRTVGSWESFSRRASSSTAGA